MFPNFWSVYGLRKVLGKEVLILSDKNLIVLTSNKKTTFLISGVGVFKKTDQPIKPKKPRKN
jgi:hypothetical protein